MTAYNQVNGSTMTEHRTLVQDVLRGEWGFDGCNVSDWTAARNTVRALRGGLDVAMPGPRTVYGAPLAEVVRTGEVTEAEVDAAVRRVLLLAARTGCLDGVLTAVGPAEVPRGPTAGRWPVRSPGGPVSCCATSRWARGGHCRWMPPRSAGSPSSGRPHARHGCSAAGPRPSFPTRSSPRWKGCAPHSPMTSRSPSRPHADPRSRVAHAREGFTLRARYLAADGQAARRDRAIRRQGAGDGPLPRGRHPAEPARRRTDRQLHPAGHRPPHPRRLRHR